MKEKKKILFLVIGIIAAVVLVIVGTSYALWVFKASQTTSNVIISGCLKLELTDKNPIDLSDNAYPLTDEESESLVPYTFTIENKCTTSNYYQINLDVMDVSNRLASKYIAINFNNTGITKLNSYQSVAPSYKESDYTAIEAYGLASGTLAGNETKNFNLKLWMAEDTLASTETMEKNFISKITISATNTILAKDTYKESILNGADPVLKDNLVPVNILDNGTVIKANTSEAWYNYGNKKWANAVILENESVTYNDYEIIPESNIESYFVWIPKYSYQLWDLGLYEGSTAIDSSKVHSIPISFGVTNTSDAKDGECTTPGWNETTKSYDGSNVSGDSGNCQVGDYMTHPAFISMDTNGLWVAKFETGYKGATTREVAQTNSIDTNKIQVKPNVYSWREMNLAIAFQNTYNYQRNLDSHMIKNSEWGAVAYLSHSDYGQLSAVGKNSCSEYKTGIGTTFDVSTKDDKICFSKDNQWNGVYGKLASTTGNISGIYDMSGGSYEHSMVFMKRQDNKGVIVGRNTSSNQTTMFNGKNYSGEDTTNGYELPEEKYYDLYNYYMYAVGSDCMSIRILGDATGELGPFYNLTSSWYNSKASPIDGYSPTLARGNGVGYAGTEANGGIFSFNSGTGQASPNLGYRIVLAVK